jgi:putative ABC transport system ATP-binding protein
MFTSVSNLTKSYNTGIITHVLKGVGLEMERGQIGVILGPSGSGKSTLMNIIGGVDRRTAARSKWTASVSRI